MRDVGRVGMFANASVLKNIERSAETPAPRA